MFGHKQKKVNRTAIFTSCLEAGINLQIHCNLEILSTASFTHIIVSFLNRHFLIRREKMAPIPEQ